MKHLLFSLAVAPTVLQAETYVIDTKVNEVTVYPEGAEIVRTGMFRVPTGRHRLILLGIPATDVDTQLATMQIQAEGLNQTATVVRGDDVPWHDYVSDEVRQAERHVDDIKTRMAEVQDRANLALLKADASRHKIEFLSNLGGNEGLVGTDVNNLRDLARMVEDESLSAERTAHSADIEARAIRKNLEDLQRELEAAKADLAALVPETKDRLFLAVDVVANDAVDGMINVSYLDFYSANWQPGYEFNLTTGEAPEVSIHRQIRVNQRTGENWTDITLHVSTLQPVGQNSAAQLNPLRRVIREKQPPQRQQDFGNLEEPVVEAPVVVEETQGWAFSANSIQGTGITYTLSDPVSIASDNEIVEIRLDGKSQPAEVFASATPARDHVAYRTARFTNPYPQTLFSAPIARWRVNGVLVATDYSPEVGPSEEIEMGFGPVHGLTLERNILNRSSGDTGLISRSNQSIETAQIQVRNLTDQTWPLRIQDRVPYSEQDDLTIEWSASPAPTEENFDNMRGVLSWSVELQPGGKETIDLETRLSWPENMELR